MSLPILKVTTTLSPEALARQYVQSEVVMSQALCEPLPIEVGAFCDPVLDPLPRANRVLDAFVQDSAAAERLLEQVEESFAACGGKCRQWSLNPTTPSDVASKLRNVIQSSGFEKRLHHLCVLHQTPDWNQLKPKLQVIPARGSPGSVETLFAESDLPHANVLGKAAARWVDEPRLDSLLALEGRRPIGYIAVMTLGQVGRLMDLYVAPTHRRRGIGTELTFRAMEICARSLFHHVFASETNAATQQLLERFGFGKAATVDVFERHA